MTDVPTIQLPDNEPQVLTTLLDAAGRQLGLQAFESASYFAKKIAAAQQAVGKGNVIDIPPEDIKAA